MPMLINAVLRKKVEHNRLMVLPQNVHSEFDHSFPAILYCAMPDATHNSDGTIPAPPSPGSARGPRRLILLLLAILTLLTVGLTIVDYHRVQRLTYELAVEQAVSLVREVESAVNRAALAEESVRLALTEQLFAVAYLVGQQLEWSEGNAAELATACLLGGVSRIERFNAGVELRAGSDDGPAAALTQPDWVSAAGAVEWVQGFHGGATGEEYYGVVVQLPDGDYIRVSVRSPELMAIRRDLGPGSILLDLAEQPQVRYALLDSEEGFVAATGDLPPWLTASPVDPFHADAMAAADFQADFLQTPEGSLFEARAPFGMAGELVLRLGLNTDHLQSIRQRNLGVLVIRSLLFVLLATALAAYLISRQNLRWLAKERRRILREIRSLEANRTLQERLSAMGELAGGVAHEIRNPLNTIIMAAQRLKKEIDPTGQPEQYQGILNALQSEAQRIERIISDFLAFARPPRARKTATEPLRELQPVLDSFRQLTDGRNVEFAVEVESLPECRLDGDLLRQAVLNLLQNALEAVPAETGRIRLRGFSEAGWLVIAVEDNGPGIPPERRQQVFDLYFTTKQAGTGVGLPLVHRVAMEHQGRVEIAASSLGGASFRLYLNRESEEV